MSKVEQLLYQKRRDVEMRKSRAKWDLADIPKEDRRVNWSKDCFHLIAEIKRSSLSAGTIRSDLNPAALAQAYEQAGVSAVSVLTEENCFHGSLEDLRAVRKAVSVPVLQKDFIVDEYQILEAKRAGADFVLLIARFLNRNELKSYLRLCREIRINALVEIADETDLDKLDETVEWIGVNSRDLETLQTDTRKFSRLRKLLPDAFCIAESGISSLRTLGEVIDLGYHAALVGEHLLRAADPAVEAARFVEFSRRIRVKICGITNEHDALQAIDAGADALGFIFAESPRRIPPDILGQFRHRIPKGVLCAGVFRDQSRDSIMETMEKFQLDIAQTYDPVELPFPTWQARTLTTGSEIDMQDPADHLLWDVRAEEYQLPEIWKKLSCRKIFALAGGLHAENVSRAISICRPLWVDAARGVEKAPGIKDKNKLQAFLERASVPTKIRGTGLSVRRGEQGRPRHEKK